MDKAPKCKNNLLVRLPSIDEQLLILSSRSFLTIKWLRLLTVNIIVCVFHRSLSNDHDDRLRFQLAGLYPTTDDRMYLDGTLPCLAHAGCSMLHYEVELGSWSLPTDVEHHNKNRYELHVLVLCLREGTCTRYNVFHDGYQNRDYHSNDNRSTVSIEGLSRIA